MSSIRQELWPWEQFQISFHSCQAFSNHFKFPSTLVRLFLITKHYKHWTWWKDELNPSRTVAVRAISNSPSTLVRLFQKCQKTKNLTGVEGKFWKKIPPLYHSQSKDDLSGTISTTPGEKMSSIRQELWPWEPFQFSFHSCQAFSKIWLSSSCRGLKWKVVQIGQNSQGM